MSAKIILFVPKPNPNREALIKEAREIYESIFPVAENVSLIEGPHENAIWGPNGFLPKEPA